MKLSKLFAFFLLLFFYRGSLAQSNSSPIPPSPNTASLLKYAQLPVSKYTGLPDISIPLYTIKSGSLSLPISISYHASGIKTSEDASWIGLGWALNCGGVIGRSIRGGDDFGANTIGYPGSNAVLDQAGFPGIAVPSYCHYQGPLYAAIDEVLHSNADTEPDLFYFNMGGYSGKFYIGRQFLSGDVYATQLDQKSNLKIKVIYGEKRFIITDGNGIQYYFGTREYAYSEGQAIPGYGSYTQLTIHGNCEDSRTISSWYLDTIAAPTGDRICFQYQAPEQCYGVTSATTFSESHYKHMGCGADADYYNLSRSVTQEVRLTGVTFKGGHVDFYGSSRNDITAYGTYVPNKLDAITIKQDNVDVPLRSFTFNYDYFNFNGRLKLTQLYADDKPYVFAYDETIPLPPKETLAQDHWGYYNGSIDNHSLIPRTLFNSEDIFWTTGGNRDPNFDYAKAGVLTGITYPTGGQVKFDYELNDYQGSSPIFQGVTNSIEANLNYYSNNPSVPSITKDFYLPRTTTLTISGASSGNLPCDQLSSAPTAGEAFAVLVPIASEGATGYSSIQEYSPAEIAASITYDGCSGNSFSVAKSLNVKLNPGWYRMITEANYDQTVSTMSVFFNAITGYNPGVPGAGLRVKRITSTDANNYTSIRRYAYRLADDMSVSSGRLMTPPDYKNYLTFPCDGGWGGNYDLYTSTTSIPLSTDAQGGFIGYDAVTEFFGENGENGKLVSIYKNQNWPSQRAGIPPIEDPSNGLLTNEKTYTATGSLLKAIENSYVEFLPASVAIHGLNYQAPPFLYDWPAESYAPPCIPDEGMAPYFELTSYIVNCPWFRLLSTTTTDYTPTGPKVTVTGYSYNNLNKQIARQKTTTSDNNFLTTRYKYATDYGSSAGSIYAAMVAANMINEPIETQTWREVGTDDLLIGSTATQYSYFANNKFISPLQQYQLNTQTALSSTAVGENSASTGPFNNLLFNSSFFSLKREFDYDNVGNPVKVTQNGWQNNSYQWGYNQQYPIAECKNATNTEFYYEGFEESTASGVTTGAAHTGSKYTTSGTVTWTLPNSRTYMISYWYLNSGIWTYSGEQAFTGSFTMQAGASGYDDVRIYPADAQITTYTYTPLVGMSSMTDAKGQTTYYEYDGFQRLVNIKDQYGNILKHTDYHYQNQ